MHVCHEHDCASCWCLSFVTNNSKPHVALEMAPDFKHDCRTTHGAWICAASGLTIFKPIVSHTIIINCVLLHSFSACFNHIFIMCLFILSWRCGNHVPSHKFTRHRLIAWRWLYVCGPAGSSISNFDWCVANISAAASRAAVHWCWQKGPDDAARWDERIHSGNTRQ